MPCPLARPLLSTELKPNFGPNFKASVLDFGVTPASRSGSDQLAYELTKVRLAGGSVTYKL